MLAVKHTHVVNRRLGHSAVEVEVDRPLWPRLLPYRVQLHVAHDRRTGQIDELIRTARVGCRTGPKLEQLPVVTDDLDLHARWVRVWTVVFCEPSAVSPGSAHFAYSVNAPVTGRVKSYDTVPSCSVVHPTKVLPSSGRRTGPGFGSDTVSQTVSVPEPVVIAAGGSVPITQTMEREGYEFAGWKTRGGTVLAVGDELSSVQADTSLPQPVNTYPSRTDGAPAPGTLGVPPRTTACAGMRAGAV